MPEHELQATFGVGAAEHPNRKKPSLAQELQRLLLHFSVAASADADERDIFPAAGQFLFSHRRGTTPIYAGNAHTYLCNMHVQTTTCTQVNRCVLCRSSLESR
jgi:hypothetical protein